MEKYLGKRRKENRKNRQAITSCTCNSYKNIYITSYHSLLSKLEIKNTLLLILYVPTVV